jgi:hypothetical protein
VNLFEIRYQYGISLFIEFRLSDTYVFLETLGAGHKTKAARCGSSGARGVSRKKQR